MPKPRALTANQEFAAYAKFKAAKGAYGITSLLAREYRLSVPGMRGILQRVARETELLDSRESNNFEGAQL